MPEGDTVHKVAAAVRPLLVGRTVRLVQSRDPETRALDGHRVASVAAKGKHLLIAFESDWVLRSHLGLHGSWHRYSPGEVWRRPQRRASLVLRTDEDVLVCFDAREVELLRASGIRLDNRLRRLGPDLLGQEANPALVVRRARELCERSDLVADVLLDQRVASGIGNVYKSELLFLERLSPERVLSSVDDEALAGLYRRAAELLGKNLGGGPRTTRFIRDGRGRLWVYGRTGRACFRCGNRVVSRRLGRNLRSTYWCSTCQNAEESPERGGSQERVRSSGRRSKTK